MSDGNDGLKDWEEISVQPSPAIEQWLCPPSSPTPHSPSLHDDFSVFPPSNHEDLPLHPLHQQDGPSTNIPQPSSASSPPPEEQEEVREIEKKEEPIFRARVSGAVEKGLVWFNLFWSKFLIAYEAKRSRAWWSLAVGATLAALLLFRQRWRAKNKLLLLQIRERDEKIDQLMHQLTEMKAAVSARRKVSVIRIA